MRKLLALLFLFLPLPAQAAMDKPDEIKPYIHALTPYGDGFYTWAVVTAYEATLWTDAGQWSEQSLFALCLKYNMHFTTQEIVSRSLKEMDGIEALSDAQRKIYETQLTALIPEVKKGDVITALHLPGKGAQFFYNGKHTGNIADTAFADRFFAIWLSPKTSAPDLRTALLPH
jgi:hypothetical protein